MKIQMQLIDKLEGTLWKDPHQKNKNNTTQQNTIKFKRNSSTCSLKHF